MLKIGLTGGIGSGKSVAANLFSELEIPVIDADRIARDIVEPDMPAYQEVVRLFSPECVDTDGKLKRDLIRDIIFSDNKKKCHLEELLHPRIKEEMLGQIENLDAPYCILVIPLLLETGQDELVDRVLAIDASEKTRRERISIRDKLDGTQITTIMQLQTPRNNLLQAADDIITNDGSLEELKAQVTLMHRKYLKLAEIND